MKLFLVLGSSILLVLGIVGSAFAHPIETCNAGTISAGSHTSITVTGQCGFPASGVVTINGNLTVADGAILNDHAVSGATVHITGSVKVGKGAVLGLGYGPDEENPTEATVGGNIAADQPLTLYLGHVTVGGTVRSNGGGDPGRNFPIKDNTIGGSLVLNGWHGLWIGAIRNHVSGNVTVSNNTAANPSELPGSDSTEVQTNVIGGSLICHNNTPTAQVNMFDGGQPNIVGGNAYGECPPRIVTNPT